jgi:hypothetical protein
MKISDDYNAKFIFWTRDPKPQLGIPDAKLPRFSPKRFSSYEEMNAWKRELLIQIARELPPAHDESNNSNAR